MRSGACARRFTVYDAFDVLQFVTIDNFIISVKSVTRMEIDNKSRTSPRHSLDFVYTFSASSILHQRASVTYWKVTYRGLLQSRACFRSYINLLCLSQVK